MEIINLIGEPVSHILPSLGDGIIVDALEKDKFKYIKVSFPVAEKELTFVFPDVFTENKLLSSNSSVVNGMLEIVAPKPAHQSTATTPVKPKLDHHSAPKGGKSGTYGRFEREYPNHAVIMREGAFYSAHNESAYVLAHAMDYKLGYDMYGRPTTGGPDANVIEAGLRSVKFSFILVEDKEVKTRFDGRDPFVLLKLKDSSFSLDIKTGPPNEHIKVAENHASGSDNDDDFAWFEEFDEEAAKQATPIYKSLYPYVPVYILPFAPDSAGITYAILDYKNRKEPAFSRLTEELVPLIVQMANESVKDKTILVPVPTSQVGHTPATAESIRIIAGKDLHAFGLDPSKTIYPGRGLLKRIKDVPKAHLQKTSERAPVEVHVESMKCARDVLPNDYLYILVDDIVSSGTQLRACKKVLMSCGVNYENIVAVTVGETYYPPEGAVQ